MLSNSDFSVDTFSLQESEIALKNIDLAVTKSLNTQLRDPATTYTFAKNTEVKSLSNWIIEQACKPTDLFRINKRRDIAKNSKSLKRA